MVKSFIKKIMKSMLIKAQVKSKKIQTCDFVFWKSKKNNNFNDLWKYDSILAM
jgi:hypothetical protein